MSNSLSAASSRRAAASRRCTTSGGSVPRRGEPADQLRPGRGGQEDQAGVGHAPPHLPRPLQVDLQEARNPGGQLLFKGVSRRSVPIARELRPFQQLAFVDHPVEFLIVDKEIFAPVDLPRPRRPRRDRDRKPQFGAEPAQFRDDRALPDPGGPGEHGQPGELPHGRAVSTADRRGSAGGGGVPGKTPDWATMPGCCPLPDSAGRLRCPNRTRALAPSAGSHRARARGGTRRCRAVP